MAIRLGHVHCPGLGFGFKTLLWKYLLEDRKGVANILGLEGVFALNGNKVYTLPYILLIFLKFQLVQFLKC